MILHPGALALIAGAALVFIMVTFASILAVQILAKWNIDSSSPAQLALERKTYLISSLVNLFLLFEVISLFLFVITTNAMHNSFTGAMCSTGTLNANPIGWWVLFLKILLFFTASIWVTLNYFDQRAVQFPLVRLKYLLLLLLVPLLGSDLLLLVKYFTGLHPEIITSCCGSLFSAQGGGFAGELTGLSARPMLVVYYIVGGTTIFVAGMCLWRGKPWRQVLLGLSIIFFFVALASIVSFISLYIYELPTHHCPFDIVQDHYNYIGYPIYWSLFFGTFFGLLPGLMQPFHRKKSLCDAIFRAEKKWLALCFWHIAALLAFTSWPIIFGNLDYL